MYYGIEFFGMRGYDFFNTLGTIVSVLCSIFFIKSRVQNLGLLSSCISVRLGNKNKIIGNIFKYFTGIFEGMLIAWLTVSSTMFNSLFGKLVGTGANYFGALFAFIPVLLIVSFIFFEDPLKNMDISVMTVPLCLVFVKIACFVQGCCYGIPWEYGMYNQHPRRSGYQVPVQLIEAFLALAIFLFLLWYRKKAKTGTLLPTYMVIYSATRFFSEFVRREENVFLFLKKYQLLCIAGVIVGIIALLIVNRYGNKISAWFETKRNNIIYRKNKDISLLTESL